MWTIERIMESKKNKQVIKPTIRTREDSHAGTEPWLKMEGAKFIWSNIFLISYVNMLILMLKEQGLH